MLHRVATTDQRFTRSQIETAIRFLLDRGADPSIRDGMYTARRLAGPATSRRATGVDLLIDRAGTHDAVGCDRFARWWRTIQDWRTQAMRTAGRRLHGALTHGTEMIDLR